MKKEPLWYSLIFLISTTSLFSALFIQPARAEGAIYIRADGSIDPPTAPISTNDNVTYTLTGNVNVNVIKDKGLE
jgi:hypothetical protein